MTTVKSAGKQGCPCIDASSILSSLTERKCTTPNQEPGILRSPRSESCVPYSYGSNHCLLHDLSHDPACDLTIVQNNGADIPPYCISSWCYVDVESCVSHSEARVFRSDYFAESDVFYSYETCNSTYVWAGSDNALGGISIKAAIPDYSLPMIYKMSGVEMLDTPPREEFYNNSVPFEGVYINYINDIKKIADGDIKNIVYTPRSKASGIVHPYSSYTAAVQDIEDGIVDMAIGPFWITSQRLKMTAFTVPFVYDKTVLVIPKPGEKKSLFHQTSKVLEPFTKGLWGLVIAIILVTALLSVWFSDKPKRSNEGRRRESLQQTKPQQQRRSIVISQKQHSRLRKGVYARKSLDAILQKGMFFFSAGVDQDAGASLSHKLLMFGFSFFILISVSAYVANLAAFLTRSVPDYIGTMEGAVEYGLKICGHPALKDDLEKAWPSAIFVYSDTHPEKFGLYDYDAGKCDVMAVGVQDVTMDMNLMNLFCDRGLVFTDSVIIENPMAFPIKPELAKGFSYWMYESEKYHGVSLEQSKVAYSTLLKMETKCNYELSQQDEEQSDYTQISPLNMSFPIFFWGIFSIIAIIVQIVFVWKTKKGKDSMILGRASSYDLFAKSYRTVKKTSLVNKNGGDDAVNSCATVAIPSKSDGPSSYDLENRLTESVIEPISTFHELDVSQNNLIDDFDENSHAPPILASSADPLKRRKKVTVHTGSDSNCSEREYDITCRMERLVETGAVAEFFECFQELKKIKGK